MATLESQYSNALGCERIIGRGFVSTGGRESTVGFLKLLNLKPDDYVLDVGCGLGGGAFLMEEEYGARVLGVDLLQSMIDLALQRQREVNSVQTTFVVDDITTASLNDGEFDLVYCRNVMTHIADKEALFTNFFKWLKPGGRLFVTAYACRNGYLTPEFIQYTKLYDYHYLAACEYEQLVKDCGFADVVVTDERDKFLTFSCRELDRLVDMKEDFINEYSQDEYDDNVNCWQDKNDRTVEGSQTWLSISARKPQTILFN